MFLNWDHMFGNGSVDKLKNIFAWLINVHYNIIWFFSVASIAITIYTRMRTLDGRYSTSIQTGSDPLANQFDIFIYLTMPIGNKI